MMKTDALPEEVTADDADRKIGTPERDHSTTVGADNNTETSPNESAPDNADEEIGVSCCSHRPKIEPNAVSGVPTTTDPLQQLPVVAIRRDPDVQPRVAVDSATVDQYAEAMQDGAVFPPIDVFWDGKVYWLADGFHRVAATEKAEEDQLQARVHEGTKRDAILHAAGSNATHGLQRGNADKRRAVGLLLSDTKWAEWSDREVGRRCGVSHTFVSNVRRKLPGKGTDEQASKKRRVRRGSSEYVMRPGSRVAEKGSAKNVSSSPQTWKDSGSASKVRARVPSGMLQTKGSTIPTRELIIMAVYVRALDEEVGESVACLVHARVKELLGKRYPGYYEAARTEIKCRMPERKMAANVVEG
jgi:hypothetical protein